MNRLIIYLAFIGLLTGVSCSDDFLEKGPLAVETSEQYYNTDENALSGLYAMYNVMRGSETYGTNKWVVGSISSDIAEGGGETGGSDQPDKQKIDQLSHDARNTVLEEYWYGWYAGIYRANILIQELTDNDNLTVDIRDRILGEAYLLRGLFHFELVMAFGGVPIIDKIYPPDELQLPRNTVAEVFAAIEKDLDKAEAILEQYPTKIEGRVDYAASKALRVKVLVYESSYAELDDPNGMYAGLENRWTEAKNLAEEIIINEGTYGYALEENFATIWREVGEQSPEFIIKVNCISLASYDSPAISNGGSTFEGREGIGQLGCVYQTCRGYYSSPTNTQTDFDNLGWGFNVPTETLANTYETGDVRFESTVVTDGYKWKLTIDSDTINLWTGWSPTNYAAAKYMPWPEEKGEGALPHGGGLDIKVYRYSDFLLLAAEANLKSGNASRATELVNRVVERARNSGTSGMPTDYASVTIDDILNERMLELATEGHRFFDLVRTGKAEETLNGHFNNTIQTNVTFIKGTHEVFPIPASEIVRSNNTLTQNNGY